MILPNFIAPLANHIYQSTAFGAVAALLALALRNNRAQMRYWLWLAASIKFLIPFSLLVNLGSRVEWRTTAGVAPPLSPAIGQLGEPFARALPAMSHPALHAGWPLLAILLAALWLSGCAFVLYIWLMRWRRVRTALRAASPLPILAPIRVMSSPTLLEPGVFGVFRPALLLPDGIADRLTPAQFRAILAHELCHVRRRDNLTSALHMLVEAIFWFHPLVWWIGMRLVEERERACDEDVLRAGSEPEAYAAGILQVCRFYLESPLACASGVTGADLKKRIEAIMSNRILPALTPARKAMLAAAGMLAVALPIVVGIVNAPSIHAQATDRLRFEVASIRPMTDSSGRGGLEILPGGGLKMGGVTVKQLIGLAYGVMDNQVSGGPGWLNSETYSILAKPEGADSADNPTTTVAPGTRAWDRLRERMRTLLAERFQLVIHRDGKQTAGYLLLPAKDGAKLSQSAETGPARTNRSPGRIEAHNGTMHMLAAVLTNFLGRPVEDRTGLTGDYDYKLEYTQDPGPGGRGVADRPDGVAPDLSGPSIFTALQEQLGLRLESSRVTLETIVIDRAERPSAN